MTIESIIDRLPGNAQDLKMRCSIGICSDELPEHLDGSLTYARKLKQDIIAVIVHLQYLKDKLT